MHELRRAEPDVEIIWRAFELRPTPVPTLDPGGEYLRRVWRDAVYPLAARMGITMRLPPLQPRSRRAHEAAHWARTQNRFDDYHAAVFRALFERGEDIGDPATLARLASELKLDANALSESLARHEFEDEVLADERAAERRGVSGVPAFVANRRAMLFGVQPIEDLRELVKRARAATDTAEQDSSPPLNHLPLRIRRRGEEDV